jgi:glutamine cyclotransferase
MLFAAGSVRDIPVRAFKLCGLTWTGQCLWFSEAVTNLIMALDPHTGEVTKRIPCAGVRTDLTTIDGYLLQVVGDEMSLRVIDPDTGTAVHEVPNPRPGHVLCGLEATHGGVWMGFEDLAVIDLRSKRGFGLIDSIPIAHPVAGVTVSDRYVFYADHRGGVINVIDVALRREVAAIDVDGNPTGITWDGSQIWYCDYRTLQLRAIEVPGLVAG